jgi:hypothetical protein
MTRHCVVLSLFLATSTAIVQWVQTLGNLSIPTHKLHSAAPAVGRRAVG